MSRETPPDHPTLARRLRRARLYAVGGASLLLLLATLTLWGWAGRYKRGLSYATRHAQHGVMAYPDRLVLRRSLVSWELPRGWEPQQDNYGITTDFDVGGQLRSEHNLFQFARVAVRADRRFYSSESGRPGGYVSRELTLWVPYWLLAVLLVPLPLWIATVHRRRLIRAARRRRGQCESCGYDLRATPGRCPECGTDAPRGILPRVVRCLRRQFDRERRAARATYNVGTAQATPAAPA